MLLDRMASPDMEPAAGDSGRRGVSRRSLLRVSAALGGGLLLSIALPLPAPRATTATEDDCAPNAFVRIGRNGIVTLTIARAEMGQGIYTALAMLIAEELEVDLAQVQVEHAPADQARFANPLLGFQVTGGSTSVQTFFTPLRQAGATARALLVAAAAGQWQVDPATGHAESGSVVRGDSGRRLSYGDLVDRAAGLPTPEEVELKVPDQFKLIGTHAKRIDSAPEVNGSAVFGIDVELPGMKVATVAACPVLGDRLPFVNDGQALTIAGVRQVVRLDDAVAVVADHMGAAKRGLAALEIGWDEGANAQLSTADLVRQLVQAAARQGAVAKQQGDAATALQSTARTIDAVYQMPLLAHATMEPLNCTVHVRQDACEVWVGAQILGRARATAADAAAGSRSITPRRQCASGVRSTGRSRSSGPARRTISTIAGRFILITSPPGSMRPASR